MNNERWKDVEGYEGKYQISNFGNVKSISRHIRLQNGVLMKLPNKILKTMDRNGYRMVNLFMDGKTKSVNVHRLVALSFIPNPNNLPFVNHKDEVRSNNNVSNLEWCSCKYNLNYGTSTERRSQKRMKKLLQLSIDGILLKKWDGLALASRETGYNFKNISQCCLGKRKTANGFIWRYEDAV